ncbi:MAG: hypothetical protein IT176_05965 [Acidobacteria bacterium]|nr:hypothetical protein [Acidobacteriota bacterium]
MLRTSATPADGRASRAAPITAAILLTTAIAAAVSVDVVKQGYGVKADEATYVAAALSVAFDGDLVYQRRDLERFVGLYRHGPDGIFLKRGTDRPADRLQFGKALIYPIVAAPFVRVLGLNGFLVFHVLLLFLACVCGYRFLRARSQPAAALTFTLAFIAATCVPVYAVFLMPEIFNFTLIFVALFLWLYKEVNPDPGGILGSARSDILAAVLVGVATYSKVNHALFIAPIVLWAWWRRRFALGLGAGIAFLVATMALFGLTYATSGELNYQGGDRKSFTGTFPFDASGTDVFEATGTEMATNDADAGTVFDPAEFASRFANNAKYFAVGRHFGLLPYYFPALVCLALWLASRERRQGWRVLLFLTIVGSVAAWLVFFPFTWSGGGGPPGNRYFISQYPAFFFLLPALQSTVPGMLAFMGGALFTAKMLIDPFYAAKFPQLIAQRGAVRRLPIELPMANDLPIALDAQRSHVWYSDVLMYFLDEHSYNPEVVGPGDARGIWIAGDGRADMVLRSEWPIGHLRITASSPIKTTLIASAGAGESRVAIAAGTPVTFDLPVSGVRGFRSYAYRLSAQSTEGFTPHLLVPSSDDYRNLGALIRFSAVPAAQ